jgi:hypothetical protein
METGRLPALAAAFLPSGHDAHGLAIAPASSAQQAMSGFMRCQMWHAGENRCLLLSQDRSSVLARWRFWRLPESRRVARRIP